MKSVILPGRRPVLWGTVMAACLLSGFILSANLLFRSAAVSHVTHVTQVSQSSPEPIANPQSRIPNPGYGPPAVGLATTAGTAQPRLAEAYGKLPLSFEINRGQTDSTVKFLSRGSGYSLFLTGNEAVLALRKGNSNGKRQMAKGKSEFQYSPFDAPSSFLQRPASFQFPVSNFHTPATNDEPRTTGALLRMKLVGANPNPKIVGTDELPGKSNYFIGNDPKKWRTNVPNYAEVKYANVYPGVDLVYYGNQGKLEYDFVVAPGADPRQIALDVGAGLVPAQGHPQGVPLRIGTDGDLVVGTDGGEVIFHKPVVYQPATYNELRTTNGGGRHLVEGQYVLRGDNRISFQLAAYDRRRPVVIDPVLAYSTYLGGIADEFADAVAVDASGNAYVAGLTDSSDFPTTPGAFQTTPGGNGDAFVSKLNAAGSALLYSTYLGGSNFDVARGLAVDASGNAYVTGQTDSSNFPTTPGAFQTSFGGGGNNAFVSKLNAAGSALVYSTYLSGGGGSVGFGVAIDASENAYVTGGTGSDFSTTPGAFQTTYGGGDGDAFVSKLNAAGSGLLYSTYLGGNDDDVGYSIALDASGNAYLTGLTSSSDFPTTSGAFQTTFGGISDAFVSKLNAAGSALVYSTYLGGSAYDLGGGIMADASGNAYVTGLAASSNFPTTPGAFQTTGNSDAFVTKLNSIGSALLYSTYLGGGDAWGAGVALDASGNAYVTGFAGSDFPTTPGAFQTTFGGGSSLIPYDAFVSKLNAAGSALVYSTYLGGSGGENGYGIAVDASGNAYVTGFTDSSNFPTTPGAFQTAFGGGSFYGDVFVAKLSVADVPGIALGPGSLTFAPQVVGTTSAPQAVTLLDGGSQPLSITSMVASGDFTQTNDCGSAVEPGAPCTLSVTFTPAATGISTGAVTITDNAAGSPHQLPLTGTGGIPVVSLTPGSLTFASQTVRTTSPAQPATLKNMGSGPLSITSIAAAGDFAQTNNCGSLVQAGAACTLSVTFTPTASGTRTGAVTITDNAAGSPHQLLLTGTGVGGVPAVSLIPASLTFAPRTLWTTSPPQPVTLTNTGTATLDITSIATAGDFAQTNDCGSTLQPTLYCTFSVVFTPTAQGTRSGTLTITDNAPGSPHSVPLTGTGVVQAGQSFTFNTLAQGVDGNLYGTASQGGSFSLGTVFKVTPTGSVTTLYSFDSTHGAVPYAGLVLGTDGNFYGTTYEGGSNGYGTVFQITPGGVLTTLLSFEGTFGDSDGSYPQAALVQGTDGNFYGTASQGGTYGLGTIFRISPFAIVHTFQYLPHPRAALVQGSDGNFYGATANGAAKGCGVVFQITPRGLLNSVHEFDCTDGAYPEAALVEGSDGNLYGTTAEGGASGNGTVFRVGRFGAGFATLHSFASTDGSRPGAGLVLATDGNFYGTTWGGGSSGCGTLFQITPAGTLTTLYNFNCTTDGGLPYGGPVQYTNGTLYATNGAGQVFSLNVGLGPFVKTVPAARKVGEPVTILGTNLTGTTSVSFNGTAATFTVVSSSEITTTVPAGASSGAVQVVTPSGTLSSNVGFRVVPSISSFSPASGPVGANVAIKGQGFTGATRVAFGGVKATSFTVDSSTEITAIVPSGAKTGKITVTTPGGIATSPRIFTVG